MGWSTSPVHRAPSEPGGESFTGPASNWGVLTGHEPVAPAHPAQQSYALQELPISMRKAMVPPWVRDLSRLLESQAAAGAALTRLRGVERALRSPAGTSQLSESVLRGAASELRWVARRSTASPALARLLDRFENDLVLPAMRRARANAPR